MEAVGARAAVRGVAVGRRVGCTRVGAGARGAAPRAAAAAEVPCKTLDGGDAGTASLALKAARPDAANGIVHKYVVHVRRNARQGNASTLTRSEVSGGGRKPMKQKGTGNARKGSTRTPLAPGGGVSFGPKPRDWTAKMNKKERRLAMATALMSASADMVVVDNITEAEFPAPKTKQFADALLKLGVTEEDSVLFIAAEKVASVQKSASNIGRLMQCTTDDLSVLEILKADKIVCERGALDAINSFYGEEGAAWA